MRKFDELYTQKLRALDNEKLLLKFAELVAICEVYKCQLASAEILRRMK